MFLAVLVLAASALTLSLQGRGGGSGAPTPAPSAADLAGLQAQASGAPVDGISCEAMEQVLFHIHAHLAAFVDGRSVTLPAGIGIPPPRTVQQSSEGPFVSGGSCYYWLHSHTADGIIHIESPVARTFTLGNYFDIWNQPLDEGHVGPAAGKVTSYLNGQPFSGNPRDIPLTAHALIQLDVGTAVSPQPFVFPAGL